MNGGGKVVCVTGASGYVASWLVKLLLSRGYTVKATVRDPCDPKKTEHLLALDRAKERLQLFKANLLEEGSFDPAIEGCDGVFHTASPVILSVANPQAELIDPAVKGTLNVLKSCARASSVKRVIVTSSTATVLFPRPTLKPDDLVDETYFSDPTVCENLKMWYVLSKTLAEDAAWKFAKENGIDLITINPGLVIGPVLQPTLNCSIELVVELINGKNPFNSRAYKVIDVRDVALAHVKAFEIPSANGRYIMDGPTTTLDKMEKVFREVYPNLRLTGKNEEAERFPVNYNVSVEKVKSLGIEFTPAEVSLRDTVISLKEKGFVADSDEIDEVSPRPK